MLPQKTIKHILKLQQKKYRKEFAEFLVEGVKGVYEGLRSDADVLLVLVEGSRRDEPEFAELIQLAEEKDVAIEFVVRKDIGEIKTTETFPGVLAVISIPEIAPEDVLEGGPVIVLDNIKDPGNLGTIIRTADWFGIEHIVLSEDSVDPYNPKVVRSTMGSIFRIKIFEAQHLENFLRNASKEYVLVGLDLDAAPIEKLKPKKNAMYIFGSESHGLRPELEQMLHERYTIAGKGSAESLNVAVSAGILMSKL